MGLLPDTQNCRLRMRREWQERFPRHRELAIPTCITCRTACGDRQLTASLAVGGGENVPGIPGAWANHNFAYLVIGPRSSLSNTRVLLHQYQSQIPFN